MKRYLTTEQRRSAIKLAYNDRNWIDKVNAMSNKQIYAIFEKLKKDGIINLDGNGNIFFRTREEVNELKKRRKEQNKCHQITLDEFFGDLVMQKEKEKRNGNDE